MPLRRHHPFILWFRIRIFPHNTASCRRYLVHNLLLGLFLRQHALILFIFLVLLFFWNKIHILSASNHSIHCLTAGRFSATYYSIVLSNCSFCCQIRCSEPISSIYYMITRVMTDISSHSARRRGT